MNDATASTLPSTWLRLELGEVVAYGSTEKAEPETISSDTWVLELEDIEKDTSRIVQKLTFAERQSKSTKNRFERGDVLYGKLRPYLNKVVQADRAGVCTTEIVPIKPNAAINARFLYHWLRHPEFLTYVSEVSHGVNMPRLGTEAGRAAPFVLAPLPEQKRIADKLDSVLARVDACRDRLDRLPALLKRFRQSILAAATSGRLTEGLRSSSSFASWDETSCSAVSSFQNGYAFKSETFESNGEFQIVKLANVKDGAIKLDAAPAFLAAKNAEEFLRFQPSSGDLLISMTGTRYKRDYGFVCEVPSNFSLLINQRVGRFIPDASKILGEFLAITLRSEQFRSQFFEGETGGVNQGNVGSEHIKSCNLMLPSLQEQTEIVRRVEILFAFADRLEARLATARQQVGQLTPALLAKAFRGELVAQDPADEPAAELLKRLAAQREAAPKVRRGRAKG